MNSIQVLTDKLPPNAYDMICNYYNTHKPNEASPIRKAGVYEGGFEIPLTKTEINQLKAKYGSLDPNQTVRQLRWNLGWLLNYGHAGLLQSEELLLLESLRNLLGPSKVRYVPYKYNKTWWENQLE